MSNLPSTTWDETSPSGAAFKNAGDNRIREFKTQIREVMDVEHQFNSSGQSTENGIHLEGSALAYYQALAPVNRPDGTALDTNDEGRLFVDSDDKTFHIWDGSAFQDILVNEVVGVTPGTATASKALIVDANKDINLGTGDLTCTDITCDNLTVNTSLTIPIDSINDTHIDWGTGANQVNTDDIPEGSTNKWSNSWGLDTGWFSHTNATLYTKIHGITITMPTDIIEYHVYWRASSSGSSIAKVNIGEEETTGRVGRVSYDGTNIYIKTGGAGFGFSVDSSGTIIDMTNGEIRVLARKAA